MNFYSRTLMTEMEAEVLLPEEARGMIGMNTSEGARAWPTLYLLHGMTDDQTIWMRRTSIERYAADKGIAVVMPTTHLGWYTDMYDGPKYFTYVSDELPKIMRQFFPRMSRDRADTWAAGLSMGGYGALKCALRAPEVFSKAASLSGGLDAALIAGRGGGPWKSYWTDVFGPAADIPGSFDDLFAAAQELAASPLRPKVWMWCGTEDFLFDQNTRMRDHLRALGYDLTWLQSPGDHQWKYWDQMIQPALDWMCAKEGD